MRKSFAGAAPLTKLTAGITTISTTFSVAAGAGYPTGAGGPFVVVINRGKANEEKILVASRATNTFTVAAGGRGYDGTAAQSHATDSEVMHVLDADTVDNANAHVNDTTRDDHTQYLNNTRHDVAARHTIGTVIATGTPGASAVGDTALAGAATTVARADHRHAREAFGATSVTITHTATTDSGTALTPARSDHNHVFAAPVSSSNVVIGGTSAIGTATTFARGDHTHSVAIGAPVASAPGDAANTGTADSVARSDHRHAREAFGDVSTAQTATVTSVAGSAVTLSRSDHNHAFSLATDVQTLAINVGGGSSAGSGTTFARGDHAHGLSTGVPVALGATATAGGAVSVSRSDHIHPTTGLVTDTLNQTIAGIKTFSSIPVLPATNPVNANDAARKGYVDAATLLESRMSDARVMVSGGGNMSLSAGYELNWSTRFIVISVGRDAAWSTTGYFDIQIPAVGTVITGVGGATNKTVVAAGIPLLTWDVLYYIIPLGAGNTSVPGNFRVANYTANFEAPSNWLPLAIRNGDSNFVYTINGKYLSPGQTIAPALADATAAPINVTKEANAEGTSVSMARSDHKHDIGTAVPVTVTVGSNVEGTSVNLARADHNHDISTAAPAANLTATTTNAAGGASSVSRSDHSHAITANVAPSDITKAAAAIGTSAALARADHKHDISTAAPVTVTIGSNVEGTATSLARSDHNHDIATASPVTLTIGGNTPGSSTSLSRADHNHDISANVAPQRITTVAQVAAIGTSIAVARADHVHESPSIVDLSTAQTVAGVKTFSSIPVLPASDPTTDNQAARKAYVDTKLTGVGTSRVFRQSATPAGPVEGDIWITGGTAAGSPLPQGIIGYAEVTTHQTGITTEVDRAGLSVTVTIPAGRVLRVSAYHILSAVTANSSAFLRIVRGTTNLVYGSTGLMTVGDVNEVTVSPSVREVLGAGTYTFKCTVGRYGGTGTISARASSLSAPAYIMVEDLGAA